jgi:hypothetical protein
MLKMYSACTREIDDAKDAVDEILTSLEYEGKLLKNTVAYISCFSECIETGVLEAIIAALPCECMAVTTHYNMLDGDIGNMMIGVTLLTSDTVEFACAFTEPLEGDPQETIFDAYNRAAAKLSEKPKLILTFAPLINVINGDTILRAFDAVSGGVPVFGTVALDHTQDYSTTQVVVNGEIAHDRLGMILMTGDISPTFSAANMLEGRVTQIHAKITSSNGNVILGINDKAAIDFVKPFGMIGEDGNVISGANITPFCISTSNGEPPVVRAVYAATPDGGIVCGGDMPVDSQLWIGSLDFNDIIETTTATLHKVLEDNNISVALMFSCTGRNMALGTQVYAEMEAVKAVMEGSGIPYHFAHSGGELCPVYDRSGKPVNRLHNFTFIVLTL